MAVKFGLSLSQILNRALPKVHNCNIRHIHKNACQFRNKESNQLIVRPSAFNVPEGDRNKETFLEAVKIYTTRPGPRRSQVEFIYSALKEMEEFGVHRDLQAYKEIIDILPKGKYIPTNMFQAEFMHYPKQQQCILDVLEQMEDNGLDKLKLKPTIPTNYFLNIIFRCLPRCGNGSNGAKYFWSPWISYKKT